MHESYESYGLAKSLTLYSNQRSRGLVDRRVALLPRNPSKLRSPGHDSQVERASPIFLEDVPTVLDYRRITGPAPDQKNPEYPLSRRIRLRTEGWRRWGPVPIWRRYAPEILPLKPSPDGSPNVLLIFKLIEEAPHISTLPPPERVATRKKRARRAWNDFYTRLDSAFDRLIF